MTESLEKVDRQILLLLNGYESQWLDAVMIAVSQKLSWLPFYLIILFLLGRSLGKSLLYLIPVIVAVIFIADQGSVVLFKNVFMRYRPCHNEEIKHLVRQLEPCRGLYGFISSHAANSFALFMLLFIVVRNHLTLKLSLLTWAVVIAISRVYVGKHYPSDVIAGAIWGMACGASGGFLWTKYIVKKITSG